MLQTSILLGSLLALMACATSSQAAGRWITHPQATQARKTPVALQFRRTLDLPGRPSHYPVRVSADNRFVLFINGKRVAQGPARGDLDHWRFEKVDLAPFLQRGRNIIAAQIWNDAGMAPAAQISSRPGFFLEAVDATLNAVDTDKDWQVRVDSSRSVTHAFPQILKAFGDIEHHYYSAGAPEAHKGEDRAWGWELGRDTAGDWSAPVAAVEAGQKAPWTLIENPLPQMLYRAINSGRVVRAVGVQASRFPRSAVNVAPNSEATILIDAGRVIAAYPELVTTGGRGSKITLTYTEALYDDKRVRLSDRASIDGQVLGISDQFLPDGGADRHYQPFWYRVWRFVELKIKTGSQPLILNTLNTHETGYPFEQRARFKSNDPELNAIWQIGWRTTLLDAHETFMDTSYWEQTQYVGDTRIEALISYAVSGDTRLAEQALDAFDASRVIDGIPQGAWPVNAKNSIPPFGLIWVGMLHDYWMRSPDTAPVNRNLDGARAVLDWYSRYSSEGGLLSKVPGWHFIDWRPSLAGRSLKGPRPKEPSCVISLLYLGALRDMAEMEGALGDATRAGRDKQDAARLAQAIRQRCWDSTRGLFADSPDRDSFSQQGNSLAILYDVAPASDHTAIFDRILLPDQGIDAPPGVTPVTYYFAFYLARALDHAGQGQRYAGVLRAWRSLLKQNFTSWPEEPDPSRTDTHAWSAHPTADLLQIVAGIRPDSPGYRTIRIAPNLGTLTRLDVVAPHPQGTVKAQYRRMNGKIRAKLVLPPSVNGTFEWGGREYPLHDGVNSFRLGELR